MVRRPAADVWDNELAGAIAGVALLISVPEVLPALAIVLGVYVGWALLVDLAPTLTYRVIMGLAAWARSATTVTATTANAPKTATSFVRSRAARVRERLISSLDGLTHPCFIPRLFLPQ
jgi:hypothetical protein